MPAVLSLGFVFFVGSIGFFIFKKLKFPIPALMGSITMALILALSGHFPSVSVEGMTAVCKAVMGIMIGRRLDRNAIALLRATVKPAALICFWMILLSITGGFLLAFISGLPLTTAMIASTTGGVSEMAVFALSMNYDAATVTMISVSRLIVVLGLTPLLASVCSRRQLPIGGSSQPEIKDNSAASPSPMSLEEISIVVIVAAACGFLLDYLHVPAGFMLGAMCATAFVSIYTGHHCGLSKKLTVAAQIGIGVAIARYFGPEHVAYLTNPRFLAALFVSAAYTISSTLLLGYLIHRMTGWKPLTCLLSSSAGGMSQMVIVAEEMNADSLTIGVMHLARYISIILSMPFLIKIFL
ncbi:MAG: AbrB family transcriptional regulator [Synergistaceae bacterium]|jgi:membrane AbrB-like protein|nr:AbrB family transcriptional regulator [Synergistaceae bacterium]